MNRRVEKKSDLEALNDHPGSRLMALIYSFSISKNILLGNTLELLMFIKRIESAEFAEMALDEYRRSSEYTQVEGQLVRLLHNFLASVKSLVDHTRKITKSGEFSEAHREQYRNKVAEIFGDDHSKFVEDLRNFSVHFGPIPTNSIFDLSSSQWMVGISIEDLKEWGKWTSSSRNFMSQFENIRLSWLVGVYQDKSLRMTEWLVKSIPEHYRDVLEERDVLQSKVYPRGEA